MSLLKRRMRPLAHPAFVFALAAASAMACGEPSRPSGVGTARQAEHDANKPFPRPDPDPLPDFPLEVIGHTDSLGYLPGTAGVSPDGAATYTIPLAVPPGVRGMQPSLSLAYSSKAGNGLLGVGWALVGASQIERCHKTLRTEGVTAGYDFTGDDSFCLNGAKLVKIGTTPEGPEYRTESSPFDKIVHNESSNTFEVWSADGRISTYKPLSLPRTKVVDVNADFAPYNDSNKLAPFRVTLEPDGEVVLMWLVDEVRDRFGNAMRYHYETVQGEPSDQGAGTATELRRITYTHHPDDPNGATREVVLHYNNRPAEERSFSYVAGIRLNHYRRIDRIEMHAPSKPGGGKQIQWWYDLEYPATLSGKTRRSQLTGVQQCVPGGACGWKKQFLWKGQGEPLNIEATYSLVSQDDPTPWALCEPPGIVSNEVRPIVFDADGDGRQDILLLHSNQIESCSGNLDTSKFKWKILLSSAGYAPQPVSYNYFIDKETSQISPGRWRIADVNNDGKDDLIAGIDEGDDSISAHGGHFKYRCYTWNQLTHDFTSCMTPEMKDSSNAGMLDARWHAGDRLRWPLWNFADFDGDGRVDLAENDHIRLNLWTNGNVATFAFSQHPLDLIDYDDAPNNEIAWPWKAYNRGAEAFDANGDGRAEILLSNPSNVHVGHVAGPSFPIGDAELMLHGLGISPAGVLTDSHVPGLSRGALPWATQAAGEIVVGEDSYFFSVSADINGDGLKDQVIIRHTTQLSGSGATLRFDGDDPLGGIGTFVQYNTGRGFTPAHRTTIQFRPIEQWLQIGPLTSFDYGDDQYYKLNTSALPAAVDVVDVNNDGRDDIVVKSMETWHWKPYENYLDIATGDKPVLDPPQMIKWGVTNANVGSSFWYTRIYISTGDDFKLIENPFDPGLPTADGDRGYIYTRPVQLDDDPAPEYITRGRAHFNGTTFPVNDLIDGWTSNEFFRVDLDAGPEEVIWAIEDYGAPEPRDVFTYRDVRFSRDGEGCHYPFSCLSRFPSLVDEHHSLQGRDENGQAIYRRVKYRWNDPPPSSPSPPAPPPPAPRMDLRGRGMLGFETTTAIDLDTGAITYTLYDDLTTAVGDFFPYAGIPTRVTSYTPILVAPSDGQPNLAPGYVRVRVSETTRTPAHKLLYGGKAYFSYVGEEHQHVYEQTMELELAMGEPRLTPVASPNLVDVSILMSDAEYDDFGNVLKATSTVLGGETRTTENTYVNDTAKWLIGLPLTHQTTSLTHTRRMGYEHDSKGHLSKIHVQPNDVDPDVISTTHRVRDSRGLVIQLAQEAPGVPVRVTNFYHDDDRVFVAQTINAAGHQSVVLRHPALGVPVLTQDPLGIQSLAKYDGFGRLLSTDGPTDLDVLSVSRKPFTDSDGHILGLKTATVLTDTSESTAITDELGRTVRSVVTGFEGESLHAATHYNLLGQPVRTTRMAQGAPSLFTTDVVYDTLGRQISVSAPDGVETTFEYEPHVTRTIDAHGHVRTVFHDAHHRPGRSEEEIVQSGQVETLTTTFQYGPFDQLARTTDPAGKIVTIRHDVLGRKTSIQDPDAGLTHFWYNGLGELRRQQTPQGQLLTFGHDDLGRLLWEDGPDGTTQYAYDTSQNGVGQLTAAVGPDDAAVVHTYDSLGRLHKAWTVLAAGEIYELEYRYDNFGRIREIAYPQDPSGERFKALFHYNSHGFADKVNRTRLAPAGQPQTQLVWETLSRDDNLALTSGVFGNGVWMGIAREPATGMAWKITAQKTPILSNPIEFQVTYQYDALRNVDLRTWSGTAFGNNTISETFDHDVLDRLTEWQVTGPVAVPTGPRKYRYDTMGNLTGVIENGQTVYQATYGVGPLPNALASSTLSNDYDYDAGGRQIKAGNREVTFTAEGKPRSVTIDGVTTELRYGPGLKRVEKLAPDSRTVYIGGLYEKRITADSTQHVFFVPGETGIAAQVIRTQTASGDITEDIRYLVRDHLGSASAAFDAAGNVEAQVFDPWGERIYHSGPSDALLSDVLHGYTDQRHEDDLGWIDMNARMYDPAQRRFISPDPLVADPLFSTGRNRFAYVLNNPLRYTDPTGMGVEETIGPPPPDVQTPTTIGGALHMPTLHVQIQPPAKTSHLPSAVIRAALRAGDVGGFGCSLGMPSSTEVSTGGHSGDSVPWREQPVVQAAGGAFVGAGIGALPGGSVVDFVATEAGVIDRGEPITARNKAIGKVVIGVVQVTLGTFLGGLGGGASATGIGAAVGVPAAAFGVGLVTNGAASVIVGSRQLQQSLSLQSKAASEDSEPETPRALPRRDPTGKVHGRLPRPQELGKYSTEELRELQEELRESVQQRIRVTVQLGRDRPHGQRQAAEQELIRQIEKHLENR